MHVGKIIKERKTGKSVQEYNGAESDKLSSSLPEGWRYMVTIFNMEEENRTSGV